MKKNTPHKMQKLGTYLKQLRKGRGLSIREAAQEAELSPGYVSKLETGNTFSTISIQNLLRLSQIYDVPPISVLKQTGFVDSDEYDLPQLAPYLRAKYNLSSQAIRDMEMALEIVSKKYGSTR